MGGFKDYFKKIQNDIKFSRAGEGHRLNQEMRSPDSSPHIQTDPSQSSTAARDAARQAALNRLEQTKKPQGPENRSKAIIQQKAKQQLCSESAAKRAKADDVPAQNKKQLENEESDMFFVCPDLFPHLVLPRFQLMKKIEEELLKEISDNELIAATILFKTFNSGHEDRAVELLCTYLTNVKNNPDNLEKYGRIRKANKVFEQIVGPLNHVDIMMKAIGFTVVW